MMIEDKGFLTEENAAAGKLFYDFGRFIVCYPGLIMGKTAFADCMKDDDIRSFYGNVMVYEIMPTSHLDREAAQAAAVYASKALENDGGALTDGIAPVSDFRSSLVDYIRTFEADQQLLPRGLCFALTAFILSLAGVRRVEERYEIMAGEDSARAVIPPEVGEAFCRLSTDMAAESLAYAALSDVGLWGCDLREITGLEDFIANMISSVQITGLKQAMKDLRIKEQW